MLMPAAMNNVDNAEVLDEPIAVEGDKQQKKIGGTFGIIARGLFNGSEKVIQVTKATRLHEVEKKLMSVCGGGCGLAFSPRVFDAELVVKFDDPRSLPFAGLQEGDVCMVEKFPADNPDYSRIADEQKKVDNLWRLFDRDPADMSTPDFSAAMSTPPPLFSFASSPPPPLPEFLLK